MNGVIFPPIGQRERMQFQTVNADRTQKTYSRGCTIHRSEFVLVRVPLKDEVEVYDDLSPDQKRFVTQNITPAEWAAAQRRVKHGDQNVSRRTDAKKGPRRGNKSGSSDQSSDG